MVNANGYDLSVGAVVEAQAPRGLPRSAAEALRAEARGGGSVAVGGGCGLDSERNTRWMNSQFLNNGAAEFAPSPEKLSDHAAFAFSHFVSGVC